MTANVGGSGYLGRNPVLNLGHPDKEHILANSQGGRFKVREGETQKQAQERFMTEVQRRLDGKPARRQSDPEEEKGITDFIKAAVKSIR